MNIPGRCVRVGLGLERLFGALFKEIEDGGLKLRMKVGLRLFDQK